MRLNKIKQYSGTLSDTTVDVNTNTFDTSAFSNKSNNSENIGDKIFNPSSHTNSIPTHLNQKLISKLQYRNDNKIAGNNKRNKKYHHNSQ